MKKFAIGSLITAGVMMALGVILAIIGTAVGGKRIIEEGVDNLLNKVSYVVGGSLGSTFSLDNMTVSFNEAYPVVDTGSISDFEIAVGSEITDVEIYMAKGNLEIRKAIRIKSVSSGTDWVDSNTMLRMEPCMYWLRRTAVRCPCIFQRSLHMNSISLWWQQGK